MDGLHRLSDRKRATVGSAGGSCAERGRRGVARGMHTPPAGASNVEAAKESLRLVFFFFFVELLIFSLFFFSFVHLHVVLMCTIMQYSSRLVVTLGTLSHSFFSSFLKNALLSLSA
ncbi:hypothetical protein STCU_11105 [Strigomonas culicis]|uniref:Uncharacterized protein n=1 Tax=Strigomonas culicis TaxID=28005 RepID=S9TF04_9TRYP|nr:hypothetical protein STCU_11105 [Strigomonas culicis]|eukprot:EPY16607.1 hypothetical protein STCU_11105 [Strigomonas culicis]